MNEQLRQQADAAAQWWVDKLTTVHKDDAQIGGREGDMFAFLSTLLVKQVSPEGQEAFRKAISDVIIEYGSKRPDSFDLILNVDYHPEGLLREILRQLPEGDAIASQLPHKTTMWISAGKVTAKNGYGASSQVVWSVNNTTE